MDQGATGAERLIRTHLRAGPNHLRARPHLHQAGTSHHDRKDHTITGPEPHTTTRRTTPQPVDRQTPLRPSLVGDCPHWVVGVPDSRDRSEVARCSSWSRGRMGVVRVPPSDGWVPVIAERLRFLRRMVRACIVVEIAPAPGGYRGRSLPCGRIWRVGQVCCAVRWRSAGPDPGGDVRVRVWWRCAAGPEVGCGPRRCGRLRG